MESLCFISKSWNFVTFQKVQIIYNAVTSEIARLLCMLLVIFNRTRMENSDKIQNFITLRIDHNDFLKIRFFCTYVHTLYFRYFLILYFKDLHILNTYFVEFEKSWRWHPIAFFTGSFFCMALFLMTKVCFVFLKYNFCYCL